MKKMQAFDTEIDDEIAEAMDDVDWYSVPDLETRSLGVSFSMYHDAQGERDRARDFFNHTMWLTLALVIICGLGIIFGLSTSIIAAGITGVLIVNSAWSRLLLSATRSLVTAQRQALLNDVASVSQKYPLDKTKIDKIVIDVDENYHD